MDSETSRVERPGAGDRSAAGGVAIDPEAADAEWWRLFRALCVTQAGSEPRSIACIGNAPLTPDATRAAAIDGADLVFRANSFVLDRPGDAPTLGSRTDVVLLSRNARITPAVFHDYRSRLYLVMQGGFTTFYTIRNLPEHWPTDLGVMPVPNRAVMSRLVALLDPDHEPGTLIPTTGLATVFLARRLFPDAGLVATGYSFLQDREQTEWVHHFGSRDPVDNRHRIDLEGALLEEWIDEGSVRFFQ